MSIQKGSVAPNFSLFDTNTNEVKLSNYIGKNVVLLFFPLAFTGVCTEELCSMRDSFKEYEDLNAEILAISVDSPFSLKKFKEENNYNFSLLSDFNKEVATKYDTIYENFLFGMKGVAKRSAFVIDKEGIIQHAEILEDAHNIPNFEVIKSTLKSLA